MITKPNPTKLAELKKGESDERKQEDYRDWLRRRGNRASQRIPATGLGDRKLIG